MTQGFDSVTWSVTSGPGTVSLLATPALFGAAAGGTVAGTITDSTGKPLGGVLAVATIRPTSGGHVSLSAKTDSKGSFAISNVPAGSFRLCVPDANGYADPCKWSAKQLTGTVQGTATATVATLALESTAPLQVQIADEAGVLSKNESSIAGAHILVGVWTSGGLFVPIPIQTKNGTGRTLSLNIPINTSLKLTVTSKAFAFKDDNGKGLLKDGAVVDLKAANEKDSKSVTVHVAGLN